jgi:hypothetical protein
LLIAEYRAPPQRVLRKSDRAGTRLTPTEEWSRVNDDEDGGRSIDLIEWTGGDEEFSVNIGGFRVKLSFFECVAEVRDSPKFFKILIDEMKNYPILIRTGIY